MKARDGRDGGSSDGDDAVVVELVDFVLRGNWDWDWLSVRSGDGDFDLEFLNVDLCRVLDGDLWGDLGDGAGRGHNLFLGDELVHGRSILGGVAHEGAQIGLHDLRVLTDDDGRLGVVDAGLECRGGDGVVGGGVVNWSRGGHLDRCSDLDGSGNSISDGRRGGNCYLDRCSNSDWSRCRCVDGSWEIVLDLGKRSRGNNWNWSWSWDGSSNWCEEVVLELRNNRGDYLDGLWHGVGHWGRCGIGQWKVRKSMKGTHWCRQSSANKQREDDLLIDNKNDNISYIQL